MVSDSSNLWWGLKHLKRNHAICLVTLSPWHDINFTTGYGHDALQYFSACLVLSCISCTQRTSVVRCSAYLGRMDSRPAVRHSLLTGSYILWDYWYPVSERERGREGESGVCLCVLDREGNKVFFSRARVDGIVDCIWPVTVIFWLVSVNDFCYLIALVWNTSSVITEIWWSEC